MVISCHATRVAKAIRTALAVCRVNGNELSKGGKLDATLHRLAKTPIISKNVGLRRGPQRRMHVAIDRAQAHRWPHVTAIYVMLSSGCASSVHAVAFYSVISVSIY